MVDDLTKNNINSDVRKWLKIKTFDEKAIKMSLSNLPIQQIKRHRRTLIQTNKLCTKETKTDLGDNKINRHKCK